MNPKGLQDFQPNLIGYAKARSVDSNPISTTTFSSLTHFRFLARSLNQAARAQHANERLCR